MANQNKNKQKTKRKASLLEIGIIGVVVIAVLVFGIAIYQHITSDSEGGDDDTTVAEDAVSQQETDYEDGNIVDYEEKGLLSLGDYKKITVEDVQPSEDDVNTEVDYLRQDHMDDTKGVKVIKGEYVGVTYVGTIDGEEFDGGTAEDEEYFQIGSGTFMDDFENALPGHKTGDTVTTDVKFPSDYDDENVAGQTAQFKIKIVSKGPNLDDTFIKKNTSYQSLAQYKKTIKEKLLKENMASTAWDNLKEKCEFKDAPENMVAAMSNAALKEYESFAEMSECSVEELLESFGMTTDDISSTGEDTAQDCMLAQTIASKEGLTMNEEMYKKMLIQFLGAEEDDDQSITTLETTFNSQSAYPKSAMLVEYVKQYVGERAKEKK